MSNQHHKCALMDKSEHFPGHNGSVTFVKWITTSIANNALLAIIRTMRHASIVIHRALRRCDTSAAFSTMPPMHCSILSTLFYVVMFMKTSKIYSYSISYTAINGYKYCYKKLWRCSPTIKCSHEHKIQNRLLKTLLQLSS